MQIFGFGGNTPVSKSLADITETFRDTLEELKQFTKEKTEEKLELEDKVAELTADISKGIEIQKNLSTILGEPHEQN